MSVKQPMATPTHPGLKAGYQKTVEAHTGQK